MSVARRTGALVCALLATFAWAEGAGPQAEAACGEELLISLYTAGDVARVDACDGSFLGLLDDADQLAGSQTLRQGPDGRLYVVSEENHRILRFDGATLAFVDVWLQDASLDKPTALDFGPDGAAYIGSYGGDRVLRFADGELSVFFEHPELDGVDAGMAFGPDGMLWVPSFEGHVLLVVDPATGAVVRRFAEGLRSPRMLLWAPDGASVLIGSWANDRIYRLALGAAGAEPELLLERARPSGLAWAADGRLLTISDTGGPVYAVAPDADPPEAQRLADDERLQAMTYLVRWPAPQGAAPAQ